MTTVQYLDYKYEVFSAMEGRMRLATAMTTKPTTCWSGELPPFCFLYYNDHRVFFSFCNDSWSIGGGFRVDE